LTLTRLTTSSALFSTLYAASLLVWNNLQLFK
jgi:hypothetical protein